jgi:hypothetical protein
VCHTASGSNNPQITETIRIAHVGSLLSGIHMLWSKPAIVGIVSLTIPNAGHAVVWDGEKIVDPGRSDKVDRAYIDRCGLKFTPRAADLQPLVAFDPVHPPTRRVPLP